MLPILQLKFAIDGLQRDDKEYASGSASVTVGRGRQINVLMDAKRALNKAEY